MIHTILEWRENAGKSVEGDITQVESLYLQNESTDTAEESASEQDVDESVTVENDMDEDSGEDGADDIKLGCVQVGEKAEFDHAPEAEKDDTASKGQPLLGLVLTPTRELAVQVKHHIDAVAKFTSKSLMQILILKLKFLNEPLLLLFYRHQNGNNSGRNVSAETEEDAEVQA